MRTEMRSPGCIAIAPPHEHLLQQPLPSSFVCDHGIPTTTPQPPTAATRRRHTLRARPPRACPRAGGGGISVPMCPWLRFEGPSAAILLGQISKPLFHGLRISSKRTNLKHDWLYIVSTYQIGSTSNGYYRFSSPQKMDMLKVQ